MFWKLVVKTVLALSKKPEVRQWAQRQARKAIDRVRNRAELRIANLYDAAGLEATPKPKLSQLVRMEKDIAHPGQVVIVGNKAIRILRLISSGSRETVYEGIEV